MFARMKFRKNRSSNHPSCAKRRNITQNRRWKHWKSPNRLRNKPSRIKPLRKDPTHLHDVPGQVCKAACHRKSNAQLFLKLSKIDENWNNHRFYHSWSRVTKEFTLYGSLKRIWIGAWKYERKQNSKIRHDEYKTTQNKRRGVPPPAARRGRQSLPHHEAADHHGILAHWDGDRFLCL